MPGGKSTAAVSLSLIVDVVPPTVRLHISVILLTPLFYLPIEMKSGFICLTRIVKLCCKEVFFVV